MSAFRTLPARLGDLFRQVPNFSFLWLRSRSIRSLLWGLPVLLLLIALGTIGVYGAQRDRTAITQHYARLAQEAARVGDHEAAELWNRKLVNLTPDNKAAWFQLALAHDEQQEPRRAEVIMTRLAPPDSKGYGPAHFWWAGRLLKQEEEQDPPTISAMREAIGHLEATLAWNAKHPAAGQLLQVARLQFAQRLLTDPVATVEQKQEAEAVLQEVLKRDRQQPEAVLWLAELHTQRKDYLGAIALLRRRIVQQPEFRFGIARLYLQAGQETQAKQEIETARDAYRKTLNEDPADIEVRLRLAEALTMLNEPVQAAEVVYEGIQLSAAGDAASPDATPADPRLLQRWVDLCLVQVNLHLQQPQPDWAKLVGLIDLGLSIAPEDSRLMTAVALVVSRNQGEELEPFRQTLLDALADGRAPTTCHLVLGTALTTSGEDIETGISHLRAALKARPNDPVVANNLAMALMDTDPPQLEEALEMAQIAAKALPSPFTYDTRGQVYFALGRYDEALVDLESAIRLEQGAEKRHAMLAEIYAARGETELAQKHRDRADVSDVSKVE